MSIKVQCQECDHTWQGDPEDQADVSDHPVTKRGITTDVRCPGSDKPGVCAECGGEGSTYTDKWSYKTDGHYTKHTICSACQPDLDEDFDRDDG